MCCITLLRTRPGMDDFITLRSKLFHPAAFPSSFLIGGPAITLQVNEALLRPMAPGFFETPARRVRCLRDRSSGVGCKRIPSGNWKTFGFGSSWGLVPTSSRAAGELTAPDSRQCLRFLLGR